MYSFKFIIKKWKYSNVIIKFKTIVIRVFTLLNWDFPSSWIIAIIKIKVLFLKVDINMLKKVLNIRKAINKVIIQVRKQKELDFVVQYSSQLIIICILINILNWIFSVISIIMIYLVKFIMISITNINVSVVPNFVSWVFQFLSNFKEISFP